jgi:formate dehydrogenase maturation protein FdhE
VNVPSTPAGSAPDEPRDVAALRRLRISAPDLAPAIDFQLAWLQIERRVDTRVPLPRTVGADALCAARLAAGRPVLEFDDLVLDWSDVRRLCGQAADCLRRADFLEPEVEALALACLRDARALPIALRQWFDRDATADANAAQVWTFGLRPYLTRASAALLPRLAADDWQRATCLVCGGDPEFAAWNGAERRLVCARCAAQWPFDPARCPSCLDADEGARQSFSDPSRTYRVEACTRCRRYVKGLDEERAGRGVLMAYDPIATIPLDAAAAQLGFE